VVDQAAASPGAVPPAPPHFGHERVDAFGVQSASLQPADEGPHMVVDVADVGRLGGPLDIERLQVPIEQLVDRRAGPGLALLVNLVQQPGQGSLGLFPGSWARRDDFDQVVTLAGDRILPA
jgi:hypothetical protein